MRKVIAGMLQILSWIVYIVIILALIVTLPILLGNHPVVVLSGSMEPAYPVDSIVYYKQAAFEDIDVGDVITFRIGAESLATHRVVEKDEVARTLSTKGDANLTQDAQPVAYSRVVGKTSRFALPFVGAITKIVQNWYIIGAMAVILLLNMFVVPEKTNEEKPFEDACESLAELRKSRHDTTPTTAPQRRHGKTPTAAQYFADL